MTSLAGIRPQKGNRDDDSQRSSLMMDEEGGSSEADGEASDCEAPKRKTVPRMGVSASALSQSSCEFQPWGRCWGESLLDKSTHVAKTQRSGCGGAPT